jgi:hypothetical protein
VKFEEILPEVRKGRKVRRKAWFGNEDGYLQKTALQGLSYYRDSGDVRYWEEFLSDDLLADDWELVPEPIRIADYLVPNLVGDYYLKQTHPIGQQPEGAVIVPNTERDQA